MSYDKFNTNAQTNVQTKWSNPQLFLQLAREQRNFYVLDVETTGYGGRDEVVEIAILDAAGEVVINELVQPVVIKHNQWSPNAIKAHGILPTQVFNSQWLIQHMGHITGVLGSLPVVFAYNAKFDARLMAQSLLASQRGDAGLHKWHWKCGMALFQGVRGSGRVSLSTAVC
jgi:DNA polymerase III alpha subunit (gram-positive type)